MYRELSPEMRVGCSIMDQFVGWAPPTIHLYGERCPPYSYSAAMDGVGMAPDHRWLGGTAWPRSDDLPEFHRSHLRPKQQREDQRDAENDRRLESCRQSLEQEQNEQA